jgi:putative transposase
MDDKVCLLVIIGSDELGNKELIAVSDGYRESEANWSEVLLGLKQRGLDIEPKVAIGRYDHFWCIGEISSSVSY